MGLLEYKMKKHWIIGLITLTVAIPSEVCAVPASPSPVPSPSPTVSAAPVPAPVPSQLWINELLANPAGTDTGHEWVELYNPTDTALAADGLKIQRLSGTVVATIPTGQVIAAHGYLAVTAMSGTLVNGGDTLLLMAGTTELDRVTYDAQGEEGWSWSRQDAETGVWTEVTTLGLPNYQPPPEPAATDPAAPPDQTGSAANTPASATPKAAATKKSASKKKVSAKKAAAKKLPQTGSSAWLYLLPVLLATLYWYRRNHDF